MVGVTPRPPFPKGYMAIYERDHFKQDVAPKIKVSRFIPRKLIDW